MLVAQANRAYMQDTFQKVGQRMECPYCKAQNRDGVRYCGSCGKQIGPATSPVPVATPGNSGSIPRSLLPGSRLQGGRYLIWQVLGEGGMGTALLAQDMRL